MGDMVFNGGKYGMWVGNQQYVRVSGHLATKEWYGFNRFTVRNVTVNNADTGIFGVWNWGTDYLSFNIGS
jgi:glucan 1,3-beta-glucosidase